MNFSPDRVVTAAVAKNNVLVPLNERVVFKTSQFSKMAEELDVSDDELCRTIQNLFIEGFDANFGGGVFEKYLNESTCYSVILLRCTKGWICESILKDNKRFSYHERRTAKLYCEFFSKLPTKDFRKLVLGNELMRMRHKFS